MGEAPGRQPRDPVTVKGDLGNTMVASLQTAVTMLREGRSAAAREVCVGLLETDAGNVHARRLLGVMELESGRAADAAAHFRRCTADVPDLALAHNNLGAALEALGEHDAAQTAYARAERLDPELHAINLMARIGAGGDPDAHVALLAEASRALRGGRLQHAEQLCRELLRASPDQVPALRILALVALQQGAPREAEIMLRRAQRLAPDSPEVLANLASALREQEKYERAAECLERACALQPDNVGLLFNYGAALVRGGRHDEGIRVLARARELDPDHAGVLLGLGHALKTRGREDEAIEAYRACIRRSASQGEAWSSLANLKVYRFSAAEQDEIRAGLEDGSLEPDQEVHLCFALAKAREDDGDYNEAFSLYERGNSRRRELVQYDPVETAVMTDRLVSVFTPELLERLSGHGCDDTAPIFIVGLPRTGSTLIEQILASHPAVDGTAELPELGRIATRIGIGRGDRRRFPEVVCGLEPRELCRLGEDYLEATRRYRAGAPRFTDKMPNNFAFVGLLRLILPGARIINTRRAPMDSCLGAYRQLFAAGQNFSYDLFELADYYRHYRRLMAHWHSVLPGWILDVHYEDMVAEPEAEIRRLLEFCGLPYESACLEFHQSDRAIRTASSAQVRRPIYREALGRWRRYERQLEPVRELIESAGD